MLLITQPRAGTSHNEIIALQAAAREMGWDVHSALGSWRLDEDLINSKVKGVPYGSQTFCEVIAQQMGWTLKQNSFDWLAKLDKKYTKRQIDFMTLGEAKKITERKFIKPADDKCFDAKVYDPGEFHPHESIPDDYPVLVSEVVEWTMEYRCFVGLGSSCPHVETWSNYLFYGDINNPKMHNMSPGEHSPAYFLSHMFLNKHMSTITVPSVIDIGIIPGKGWAVIETNQCWASGLYGCDPSAVLRVLEQSCE